MKKNGLFSDDAWIFQTFGAGTGAPAPSASHDTMFRDEGEPFPLADSAGSTFGLVVSASKPVVSIATLADYLVNGFWQYNSTPAHHWASNTISYNITGLNSAEQFLAQTAMQAWSQVANISFVQTSGAANITFTHNGTMQAYTTGTWSGSGAISSQTVNISADWITNDGGANDGKTGVDSYGYQTYIHEIGHALGLGHQGPYNGSAVYSTDAVYANDTWQYSIMSYFAEPNFSGSSYRYVVTPQMADIYAAVLMYGAATSTRIGDTVYGFNSNAGAAFNFAGYTSAPALTIYDSGGNDTLDASGYSAAQIIDLHPGAFSSVGGLVNNIGIALNTVIEKVIGGNGNDRLIASDTGSTLVGGGGNDTLIGGAGNDKLAGGSGFDILSGGGGADTFVFLLGDSLAGGQHDRITDFLSGTDHIDLSGYDAISSTGVYDQFKFIASTAFHGIAGELNYFYNSSSGFTMLQGDTNGDGLADFAIDFSGNITINQADLIGIALAPVIIEAFGATTLVEFASNYYLYAHGTASGPTLKYGGGVVSKGQYDAAPIAVEQTANGYQIVWKVDGADLFNTWNLDGNGNYQSYTAVVSGSSAALKSLETSFQQDLNADGVVGGSAGVVIEAFGATSLVLTDNTYHFGGATGVELKYGGSAVTVGQYGASPIAVEQTANGYQVAWKVDGADLFNVWYTDGNGNYQSYTPAVAGSSAALKSFETSFQQDLNGDGVIGGSSTAVVIESFGATSLVLSDNTYHFGSAGGPQLTYGGAAVVVGQYGSATPVAVEQAANGYQVAWKVSGADLFNVWYTDSNGNYQTYTPVVSGSSAELKSFETSFQQDLNGDGVIGGSATGVVIEAFGATSLVVANNSYHFGGASGTELKYGGTAVTVGQFGNASPIAVEATANGYQVAWKVDGSDLFNVWYTDTNGNYQSYTPVVSGSSAALKSFEASFHQDLNGDGVINNSPILQAALASNGVLDVSGSQHQDRFELPLISHGASNIGNQSPLAGIFSDQFFWLPADDNAIHHGLALEKMHVNGFYADSLIFV